MGQKVQGSSFSSVARDAPELAALQGLGFSCSKATRSKAPEPQQSNAQQSSRAAAKQRAVKLRSLAPELAALPQSNAQQAPEPGSGACCVAAKQRAASSGAWLRSLLCCGKATLQQSKQASKKMKKGSYLFVCAPAAPAPQPQLQLPLQPLQLHSSSSTAPAPAAPAPQLQLQLQPLQLHSRPRSLELWRWSEGGWGW